MSLHALYNYFTTEEEELVLKLFLHAILIFILVIKPTYAVDESEKKQKSPEQKTEEKSDSGVYSIDPFFDSIDVASSVGGSGSDEAALIFLAVTGVFAAILWVPYFPLLAYKAIHNKSDKIKVRQLATLQWTPLLEDDGSLNGARYSLYLDDQSEDSFLELGMAFEAGYYTVKETVRQEGGYWLLGPSMLFGGLDHEGVFGRLDLTAGSSFDADVGLVTKAELSGNYLFNSGFTLGVSVGGLFFDVRENRGLATSNDNVSLILGANAGFAF